MRKTLSGQGLKIIAAAAMLTDHLAVVLSPCGLPSWAYLTMRGIGRISFPIYCFMLVTGFTYTRSVPKYLGRLAALAVLSEVPYDMANFGVFFYPAKNNVLFTFVLALAVVWAVSRLCQKGLAGYFYSASLIAAAMLVSFVLRLDYSWKCVLLASVLYLARFETAVKYAAGSIILLINSTLIGLCAPAAFVPIHFYGGERGKTPALPFYIFYPAHMLALGAVRMYIIR
ncbi:MAG: conjugal transfer protein TraX [Butyrivibrio sp.]|nr:conjugal transfer protein TraX [Butyrivibrio sp.]